MLRPQIYVLNVVKYYLLILLMKRGLSESLLSSSQNVIQDRRQIHPQEMQDSNLPKLYRKVNQSLPELIKENIDEQISILPSFIFSPLSKFIIGWKILNVTLIYLYFVQIPIILAFQNHRSDDNNERFFKIVNIPTIIIFICGIFIDMNTSFYQNGLLRKNPQQIRRRYLKKKFILDFVSILTMVIYQIIEISKQFQNQGLKVFVIFFFIKYFELKRAEKTIISSFDLNRRMKAAFKFFVLLLKILLVCNIAACSAFFMSSFLSQHYYIEDQQGNPCTSDCFWVLNVKFAGLPLYSSQTSFNTQYIYSLYWASTTMTSIGYGDITPHNPFQVGFTVFLQFMSCLLYAYSINEIESIIRQLYAKQAKINSRLNIINVYMRDKQIDAELTAKVNAYLNNYYYTKNLRWRDTEMEIINQLTPSLRKQLYYESYSVLFSHRYFKSISKNLKQSICCNVKQVGFFEAQNIFIDNQHRQPCLYYINKGQLKYECGQRSQTLIKFLYKQDAFGIYQFFSLLRFSSQLKAIQYTLLYYLPASIWRQTLVNYQQDFQKYYEAKDEVLLYNNGWIIGYSCDFCNSKKHRTEDCLEDQLRRSILQVIMQSKILSNKRAIYFRKDFKVKFQEAHKRKRKYTMKSNQTHILEASTRSFRNKLPQPIRKSSNQQFGNKKSKQKIKNQKSKQQNLKALQRIRHNHNRETLSQASNQSLSIFEMKYQEWNIDIIRDYNDYYRQFNIDQIHFRQRQQSRRRRSSRFR